MPSSSMLEMFFFLSPSRYPLLRALLVLPLSSKPKHHPKSLICDVYASSSCVNVGTADGKLKFSIWPLCSFYIAITPAISAYPWSTCPSIRRNSDNSPKHSCFSTSNAFQAATHSMYRNSNSLPHLQFKKDRTQSLPIQTWHSDMTTVASF